MFSGWIVKRQDNRSERQMIPRNAEGSWGYKWRLIEPEGIVR